MIIAGVDGSKNSSAIVKMTIDDKTLEIIDIDYKGFIDVARISKTDDKLVFYNKKEYKSNIKKHAFMCDELDPYLDNIDYIAYEGYAFGGKGNVFDVAETIGTLKYKSYDKGSNIRVYAPGQIKKYFAFNGNANKQVMGEAYYNFDEDKKLDLSHLPIVDKNKDVKPTSDIIDAYAIAYLLLEELRVRHGIKQLPDLHEDNAKKLKRIEVFNAVTTKTEENVLVRGFAHKE